MGLPLPLTLEPMESETAEAIPAGAGWQYEPKWDGFRCLAFRDGATVSLRSKSGQDLNRYFPDIVAALSATPVEQFVLDGELVIEIDGVPSLEELQIRLHPAASRVRKLAAEHPSRLIVFDLLVDENGHNLTSETLSAWRAALEELMPRLRNLHHPASRSPGIDTAPAGHHCPAGIRRPGGRWSEPLEQWTFGGLAAGAARDRRGSSL
jgi:ATP-dependent DNA ligase